MFTSSLKTPKGNISRASQLAQVRQSWGVRAPSSERQASPTTERSPGVLRPRKHLSTW